MNKIKKEKIKLDAGERNSTNNRNENDKLNMILSVIDRIYQFFEYKCLLDKQLDRQRQPNQQQHISNQQQQNPNLRLWVTSMDDYTNLKKNVDKYQKRRFYV